MPGPVTRTRLSLPICRSATKSAPLAAVMAAIVCWAKNAWPCGWAVFWPIGKVGWRSTCWYVQTKWRKFLFFALISSKTWMIKNRCSFNGWNVFKHYVTFNFLGKKIFFTKSMAFDGWFFKGGSTQNRWILKGDFSKGGVHETDYFWWVIFQRGGGTQNRWGLMGDFSKGGVHKTDGFWWVIFQRGEYTKPIRPKLFIKTFFCRFWA